MFDTNYHHNQQEIRNLGQIWTPNIVLPIMNQSTSTNKTVKYTKLDGLLKKRPMMM